MVIKCKNSIISTIFYFFHYKKEIDAIIDSRSTYN